jgi:hypothetical protein
MNGSSHVQIAKQLDAIKRFQIDPQDEKLLDDRRYFLRPLLAFSDRLSRCDMSLLAGPQLAEAIAKDISDLNSICDRLSRFRHDRPADSAVDHLKAEVASVYTRAIQRLAPFVALAYDAGSTDRVAGEMLSEIEATKEKAESVLASMQDMAAQASVSKHAAIFDEEATRLGEEAWWWLKLTAAFAVVTLVAAVGLFALHYVVYWNEYVPPTTSQSLQLAVSAVVALSLLTYTVVWSGRVYRAKMHNSIINKHRHNALRTFETFIGEASDIQTKNAVLLQAAQAIFSPQPSGFAPTPESEAIGSPTILEVIRTATSKDSA